MLIGAATLIVSNPTFAGDYLTNTNQNAAFLRMVARGASIDVDGVYSNPAGLAFLPKDGFHLSLTGQSRLSDPVKFMQVLRFGLKMEISPRNIIKEQLQLRLSPVSTVLTNVQLGNLCRICHHGRRRKSILRQRTSHV